MRPPHHNTTHETGALLKMAIEEARTQEKKVEAYFRAHPAGHSASASKIHEVVFGWAGAVPIWSTRRAITNLTKQEVLEKTQEKTDGAFGRPEYKYRLRVQGQMRLL